MKSIQNIRTLPVSFALLLSVVLMFQICWFFVYLATWMDEGLYLYKSSALFGHGMKLYSTELPCWYTPLYFVVLGGWQEWFGYGLIAGRALSVILFVAGIYILIQVVRSINPGRTSVWMIPVILALTPSITALHISATQFAFVNLQLAMLIWVVFVYKNDQVRWWIAGILMGAIAMTRPNMIVVAPLLPVLYFWVQGWKGFKKSLLQFLVAWVLLDSLIVAVFGYGALWNLIRGFPGAAMVSTIVGLEGMPGVGAISHSDLGLKEPSWASSRPENRGSSLRHFLNGFLWPYLVVISVNLAGLIKWRKSGYRPSLAAGFSLLFFWSAVIHFYATQSYCKNCAHAYMNYSIYLGLLGVVWNSSFVVKWLETGVTERDPKTLFAGGALVVWILMALLPSGTYRKWSAPPKTELVSELAGRLDEVLPENAHVLALGFDPLIVQAVHKSNRTVSPMTINYLFSIQEPLKPGQKFDKDTQKEIKARGLWTMGLMKEWLENEYTYVLYRNDTVIHRPTLDEYYDSKELCGNFYLATRSSIAAK